MAFTMSSASVPVMQHYLGVLAVLLSRAESHLSERSSDPQALLDARIFPDMYPLRSQVQFACDFAKGAAARLGDVTVPTFADDEASFADLQGRIAATLELLAQIDEAAFDNAGGKRVALNFGGTPLAFRGEKYLTHFALPSVMFHVSIAYALIRQAGVPIGKADFLGNLPLISPERGD